MQSDPVGLEGGENSFVYVGDNPLVRVDERGLLNPGLAACPFGGPFNPVCDAGIALEALAVSAAILSTATLSGDTTEKDCPPCKTISGKIVPVGTKAYRPLDIIPDDEMQHGVYGSHHNIFVAHQNPKNCKCFWQKQKYVLKPEEITPDMIPIEPFVN